MTRALIAMLLLAGCKDKASDADDTGAEDTGTAETVYPDLDADGYTTKDDCDDENPAVNPSAAEICDDIDNDCDGVIDEGLTGAFYVDADGDGYGDPSRIVESCELTDGLVENPDDCDDGDGAVNPGAIEICNDIDDDCDEEVDEDDAADASTWYLDGDGDGFGDPDAPAVACVQPARHVLEDTDCDDSDPAVYPGAIELCNDIDDDCDRDIDEDASDAPSWYRDRDEDGYGVDEDVIVRCDAPTGYTVLGGDCNDFNDDINPGAEEICDAIDNDCDDSTTEDGVVTFESVDGVMSDVSDYFTSGSYSAPDGWILSADGIFRFCQGTYYTYVELRADIELQGMHGAEETILSAGDRVSVVEVGADGVDAIIRGLTLRDGSGSATSLGGAGFSAGGGVLCTTSSSVAIRESVITESTAYLGGGLFAYGCDVTLRQTEFTDNAGDYGGAIALIDADMTLSDSTVSDNIASYSGGGAYIDGSSGAEVRATVTNSLFEDNDAQFGGGVAVIEAGLGCVGSSSSEDGFLGNSATLGGAAFLSDATYLRSTICDWGVGGDDNSPHDVHMYQWDESYDYGDDETFSCGAYTCGD